MKLLDLTGRRFGRWTVIGRGPDAPRTNGHGRRVQWICRCDCGAEKLVVACNLTSGLSRSCGCLHLDVISTHHDTNSTEYAAWLAMKDRCHSETCINFPLYGGRGIAVCDRWLHSYENFLADMGRKPTPEHSLDRIDTDGHYEPNNCRWATRLEQNNNKRSNRLLTLGDKTLTVSEWVAKLGLHKGCILYRLNAGWPIVDVLSQPPRRGPSLRYRR